jgi:hypothetical protein
MVACFLTFPSGNTSASPMDSAAIPSLPHQWWRWQQAASHLPSMVAMAGTAFPPRGSRSSSYDASRGCGGAQFAIVMRSTASCPPGQLLRVAGELYTNEVQMPTSLYFSRATKIALKAHVTSVHFECFRCFIGMLQLFHMDVAKAD